MASVQVTTADVQERFEGDLAAFNPEYVAATIQDAVDYADRHWGPVIEQQLAAGSLTSNLYKRVIATAVLRILRNPQGFASENDGGYSYSLRAQVASGSLWFTQDEIETLTGPQSKTVPRTLRLGLEPGWGP
jgi:hypothetical protein